MTQIIPDEQPINYQLSLDGDVFASDATPVGAITATSADVVASADLNEFLGLIAGDSDQYPPLPEVGQPVEAGALYAYDGGVVQCRQAHTRMDYPPEDTPALFVVYREGGGALEWVPNEWVDVGVERVYDGDGWRCLQAHQTQTGWEPPSTPTLWALVAPVGEWQAGAAYEEGDVVVYDGVQYWCLQAHTAQVGWEPPNVPSLWEEV